MMTDIWKPAFTLEELTNVVRAAGREVLRCYTGGGNVEWKGDGSPLTEADRTSHAYLCRALTDLAHDLPVVSEESDAEEVVDRRAWRRYWLIDPLDGTREFLKRTGEFTVNVALIEDGRPIMGVVDAPALDRCYRAARGAGAQGAEGGGPFRPIRSRVPSSHPPVLVASRDHLGPGVETFAAALGDKVWFTSMGSSLKFCLVAAGEADLYLRDLPTMEWDTGAAQCVVEEAGGAVYGVVNPGDPRPLLYNKESLRNPAFLAVGDPEGPWRRPLATLRFEEVEDGRK